jgi:8-oxo-dGTP pyrophosphatase MutT (NUDIX family)
MRTIQREIVGGFIFSNDGFMLLGKSRPGGVYPGHATVPGGGVHEGESLLDAVTREVLEEVGMDVQYAKIGLVNDTQFGESKKTLRDTGEEVIVHMRFNDFHIVMPQPASQIAITSGDDFTDAVWVPVQELTNLKLTDATKHTLQKLGYL